VRSRASLPESLGHVRRHEPRASTPASGVLALQRQIGNRGVCALLRDKKKSPAVTVDNVDDVFGPLTEDVAKQVFAAYGSPLKGHEAELIAAFEKAKVSAWIGLAIIAQESSFANRENNKDLDERNEANPFSVHFTQPKQWPEGCKRNALLIADKGKKYEPEDKVGKTCAATDHRLPTFAESAAAAAKIVKDKGLEAYREQGGYAKDLNQRLHDITRKIKLQPK
jgi:hypothetical protein